MRSNDLVFLQIRILITTVSLAPSKLTDPQVVEAFLSYKSDRSPLRSDYFPKARKEQINKYIKLINWVLE